MPLQRYHTNSDTIDIAPSRQDPVAADVLCTSGCNLKIVGLDVTQQSWITVAQMQELVASGGSGGRFLNDIAQYYFAFSRNFNEVDGAFLHDPSAALAAISPDLFRWTKAPVRVVHDGFARVRTSSQSSQLVASYAA